MKKLVAFAMILSLGLFCAVGCKPAPKDTPADKGAAAEKDSAMDEGDAAPAPDAAKDGDEAEAPPAE